MSPVHFLLCSLKGVELQTIEIIRNLLRYGEVCSSILLPLSEMMGLQHHRNSVCLTNLTFGHCLWKVQRFSHSIINHLNVHIWWEYDSNKCGVFWTNDQRALFSRGLHSGGYTERPFVCSDGTSDYLVIRPVVIMHLYLLIHSPGYLWTRGHVFRRNLTQWTMLLSDSQ